jgi:hypothetical protein
MKLLIIGAASLMLGIPPVVAKETKLIEPPAPIPVEQPALLNQLSEAEKKLIHVCLRLNERIRELEEKAVSQQERIDRILERVRKLEREYKVPDDAILITPVEVNE